MSKVNLYMDCACGVSGDMLCQGLTALCGNRGFVEEQQQLISDALHHEEAHRHSHEHSHAGLEHGHGDAHEHSHEDGTGGEHAHQHGYTHRSFQSLLGLIDESELEEGVKAMTKKIYQILATAEAEVHEATLETVHFHEVGRPQAIINMVGVAAAFTALDPGQVYCSKVIDGCGTVVCAHGEIPVPVPAVRALMNRSDLEYGSSDQAMEMVTPTGLAALLAMDPKTMHGKPEPSLVIDSAVALGGRKSAGQEAHPGLKIVLFS